MTVCYPSRPVVTSTGGMVVCPHHLASTAGAAILRQGGSAVDAAIATNAALGVVYPHMTGLGGDAFWLVYHQETGQLYGLNGSGRAAQAATPEFFHQRQLASLPSRGPLAALTVPGGVDSWWVAHQRWGRLPWDALLQPAIDLARQGYPVSASQARWTRQDASLLRDHSGADNAFMPEGQLPQAGEVMVNPDLGQSLEQIAREGAKAFYQGAIAEQIGAYLTAQGGLLTAADFAQHRSTWVDPIGTDYRGYRVWELPPNTQGFTVLQMLNLIEPFDLQALGHGSADYYHLLVEATKLAFADRDRWLSDPEFVPIPTEELISKGYGDRRRARLSMTRAQALAAGQVGGDTTYSACVDAQGNAVSMIQSLYFDFGSAVVPPGTGIVLQNRGSFFSLDAAQANCLAPGKRTFHTLMPGLVQQADGRPYLVFGTMGGEGQPQTQMAMLTRVLDYGFDPQTAIDLPRWVWGRTWGAATTGLAVEGRIAPEIRQALQARGHTLRVTPDWSDELGHAHMIAIDPVTGERRGGCDPRSDGTAIGVDRER